MELVERVCAIDVGKAELVGCVRTPAETVPGRRAQEVREYPTTTPALLGLADWLRCQQVELVAMEATSDYLKPVFYLLEAEGFRLLAADRPAREERPGAEDRQAGRGLAWPRSSRPASAAIWCGHGMFTHNLGKISRLVS